MQRRTSLQTEILTSLALVMFVATGVLSLLLGFSLTSLHRLRSERDSVWLINALLAEAQVLRSDASPTMTTVFPGIVWWRAPLVSLQIERELSKEGQHNNVSDSVRPKDGTEAYSSPLSSERPSQEWETLEGVHTSPDAEAQAIAAAVQREGRPLLSNALPWEPMYFAAPDIRNNSVLVARLPVSIEESPFFASRMFLLFLFAANTAIFIGFGFYLLRRRVVIPLRNLARAARTVADGELNTRVPEAGSFETVEVAQAFNAMTNALARRSAALEEAVQNLTRANAELRTAQVGLERAERLAAVGKLAAGVAHEMGNPIGALLAFLDLARRDPGISETTREQLQRAGREGERVRRILRQLLDFARPARYSPQAVDVAAIAREMIELIETQKSFEKNVLRLHVDSEPPLAFGDPALVAQIILNLLVNAADAVRECAQPKIDVRIRVLERGVAEDVALHTSGPWVECEIADNGPGVPEDLHERIFDLFFTTKDPGQGTGIGLANSARFAEEMNGELELVPTESGACFALRLPIFNSRQNSGEKPALT